MSSFVKVHDWATDLSNCIVGRIEVKDKFRRNVLKFLKSVLTDLSEEERKVLAKDIEKWLIDN